MNDNEIINWLLESDCSIQYQVYKDLLGDQKPELREKISQVGWGKELMSKQKQDGHWGLSFYQPKWICTHYTLSDLRNLWILPNQNIHRILNLIFNTMKEKDGGINYCKSMSESEICVNGMILNYACFFGVEENKLKSIVDFMLTQQLPDGGFNCYASRYGGTHSSLHSTILTLEGIIEYDKQGYKYRLSELKKIEKESREFMLQHKLFKSDKTDKIIDKKMVSIPYPSRWRYDILRALDYFQYACVCYDERMNEAIDILIKKRNKDNLWILPTNHPGKVHFYMETVGQPSRWNTLRAMRVLRYFGMN
jgi:hypothetical protein